MLEVLLEVLLLGHEFFELPGALVGWLLDERQVLPLLLSLDSSEPFGANGVEVVGGQVHPEFLSVCRVPEDHREVRSHIALESRVKLKLDGNLKPAELSLDTEEALGHLLQTHIREFCLYLHRLYARIDLLQNVTGHGCQYRGEALILRQLSHKLHHRAKFLRFSLKGGVECLQKVHHLGFRLLAGRALGAAQRVRLINHLEGQIKE